MLAVMTVPAAFDLLVHGLACCYSAGDGTSMQLDAWAGNSLLRVSHRFASLVWTETGAAGDRFPPVLSARAVEG